MRRVSLLLLGLVCFFSSFSGVAPEKNYDLVVYGGTSSGVIAACAAAREGLKVALLEPGKHLGGLTTSGLGHVDMGNAETVGGYAMEFFNKVGKHYGMKKFCTEMESLINMGH